MRSATEIQQERPPTDSELAAEVIYERLRGPIAGLGLIFVAVVVSETVVSDESPAHRFLVAAGWLLWAAFVCEFVIRLVIARDVSTFLKRNWWQLVFLALPFLNFLRLVRTVRVARAGRLVAAAVRGSRSATRQLTSRAGWLATVTLVVILLSAATLHEFARVPYVEALHETALATIAGEPTGRSAGIAQMLDVLLGLYSVVVFAALAGMLGAYFIERRSEQRMDTATGSEHPARLP